MGALVWAMVGLALWHFTIFLPDRFWGGIVGAFLGALFGAILFGLIVNGFTVPGQADTHLSRRSRRSPARCSASRPCTSGASGKATSRCRSAWRSARSPWRWPRRSCTRSGTC